MEIASLIVRIGGDMADLLTESKKVTQTMSTMESSIKKVGGALASYFSAQAILGAVSAVVDLAGALSDMSAATGISTTALQEFKFAGDQVGVSLETITGAILQMENRLGSGDKSFAAALHDIGVSVEELQGLAPEAMFTKLVKGLHDLDDPIRRTADGMDLFGKSFGAIAPLVNSDLEAMVQHARDLGAVMDEHTVAALDDLGDKMSALKTVGEGVLAELLIPLTPALLMAADAATSAARGMSGLQKGFGDAVAGITAKGADIMASIRQFQADFLSWGGASGRLAESAQWFKDYAQVARLGQVDITNEVTNTAHATSDWRHAAEQVDEATKAILAHQTDLANIVNRLWGEDAIGKARDYAEAIEAAGGAVRMTKDGHEEWVKVLTDAIEKMKETKRTGEDLYTSLLAKQREALGLTKEGLLSSTARGSSAGALDVLPGADLGAGDQTLQAQINMLDRFGESADAVATKFDEYGQVVVQGNYAIIGALADQQTAVGGVARGWDDLHQAMLSVQHAIPTGFNYSKALEDAGYVASHPYGSAYARGGVAGDYYTPFEMPRSFAGGTDGYEYFGAGTPALLHGWEQVTPKGAGGAGAPVITVNMSGLLISNTPAAREDIRRLVNDTIASGIKRSRKFSP